MSVTVTFNKFFKLVLFVELVCELNNPCLNGAACSEIDGVNVDCACVNGYEGDFCETGGLETPESRI